MINRVDVAIAVGLLGLLVIVGMVGYTTGIAATERRISQDCSADGQFRIERKGISWVYSCSKPKLDLIKPWE